MDIFDTLYLGTSANVALDTPLTPEQKKSMIDAAAQKLSELLAGRFSAPPRLTEFDSVETSGDLMVTGPIELRSTCAHHLMPIFGSAIIGIIAADGRIIGLSKYDRVVHHFARRFQVQEELTRQIGDYLMARTEPRGLAVRVRAVHMCKTHRGVLASHNSQMISSAYYGLLKDDERLKAEFLEECRSLEGRAHP